MYVNENETFLLFFTEGNFLFLRFLDEKTKVNQLLAKTNSYHTHKKKKEHDCVMPPVICKTIPPPKSPNDIDENKENKQRNLKEKKNILRIIHSAF